MSIFAFNKGYSDAVIYETEDEPQLYILVYLSWNPSVRKKKSNNPKYDILPDIKAIQTRIDKDNSEWRAKFK
jgi:hypothetical protein